MENQNNNFALIIGVGGDLPYSVSDAKNLYKSFTDKNLIGYPKKNVILLTDKDATQKGILKAFDDLKEMTNEESTIALYYSGHGGQYGKEHKFFLQPYGMTLKNYRSTWITTEVLKEKINALPSSRLVLFLDCCHAEGMIQTGIEGFYGMAQKLNDDHGIWVMASCQDDQLSWGVDNESIFTKCLLEVLSGKHEKSFTDTEVTIMDVVEYIFKEVPARAAACIDDKNQPCIQTPFFKTQMSENLILSYFPKNVENNEAIIAELEPKVSELDEVSFIKLIKAMEAVGRVEDAINALNKNKRTQTDPDLLESLGDLYRNQYLKSKSKKMGELALNCHAKAYDLAVSTEDEEQVFTNAVKMAFMHLKLDLKRRIMREHATIALTAAEQFLYNKSSKYATLAEANIYLGKIGLAKKYYRKLGKKAGIRYKMKAYEQAVIIYNVLFEPEDKKDSFVVFLEETLLS